MTAPILAILAFAAIPFASTTDGINESEHRVKALEYVRLLQEFTGKRIG
jgi:hypothetical protein